MRIDDVRTVAMKDLRTAWRKRGIRYAFAIFTLVPAVGLPMLVRATRLAPRGIPASGVPSLLESFLFFFMLAATTLPTAIASYALVGEKVERSLEPVLATPVSVGSLLLGKVLSGVIPTLGAVWLACAVFMPLANREAEPVLGYAFYPRPETWVELFVLMPLVSLMSVHVDVIVSTRVSDVRSAQQVAGLTTLPFSGVFLAGQLGGSTLGVPGLLRMSAVVAVFVVVTFLLALRAFDREEILTRWG